jgi:pimeloyl-ACP methyl ester carboxylesterase
MRLITINGLQTAYYTGGIGSRHVLLLHGWASSGRMWLRQMWVLRRQYRLWALDLPGFGDSQCPPIDNGSIDWYANHVAAFCESAGIRPYAVVGHSMGGRVAFDLARRYPDRVERVVAISPTVTGKLGFNLDVFLLGPLGRMIGELSRHVWPVATAGAMSMYLAPRYLGSEALKRTSADLRRASWEAAIGSLRALVDDDYSPHLPEVRQPTLLICGDRDSAVPPADSRLAAQALPDARLLMLKRIHHQPTDECPDVFLSALQSFLSENGRSGEVSP